MSDMLDRIISLIPVPVWAAVCIALSLVAGLSRIEVRALETSAAKASAAHAKEFADATKREREKEHRWVASAAEVDNYANTVRETNIAATRAASEAIDRAVGSANALAAGVGGAGLAAGPGLRVAIGGGAAAGAAPSTTVGRESPAEAARVLAELYETALRRLAIVGEFADRSWLAADSCQRLYELTADSGDAGPLKAEAPEP